MQGVVRRGDLTAMEPAVEQREYEVGANGPKAPACRN
jgi:hypothetical protein